MARFSKTIFRFGFRLSVRSSVRLSVCPSEGPPKTPLSRAAARKKAAFWKNERNWLTRNQKFFFTVGRFALKDDGGGFYLLSLARFAFRTKLSQRNRTRVHATQAQVVKGYIPPCFPQPIFRFFRPSVRLFVRLVYRPARKPVAPVSFCFASPKMLRSSGEVHKSGLLG